MSHVVHSVLTGFGTCEAVQMCLFLTNCFADLEIDGYFIQCFRAALQFGQVSGDAMALDWPGLGQEQLICFQKHFKSPLHLDAVMPHLILI